MELVTVGQDLPIKRLFYVLVFNGAVVIVLQMSLSV
jgi:hypothetical protein